MTMMGLMQDCPLLVPKALSYAERFHPDVEIVSRRNEGDIHRYTFRDLGVRARKLANALTKLGIGPGDVVGTMSTCSTWGPTRNPGRGIFGCDLRIVDEQGDSVPHDGKSNGLLRVRGRLGFRLPTLFSCT